jgi:hypothetical protein
MRPNYIFVITLVQITSAKFHKNFFSSFGDEMWRDGLDYLCMYPVCVLCAKDTFFTLKTFYTSKSSFVDAQRIYHTVFNVCAAPLINHV